jgi:Carboxypeptidase regulatory-like domain/TonB dependent receptor-like, beta-barrel/TonB-dependent Receptor Plug Domain
MKRHLIWALALVLASFGSASAQETTSGSLGAIVTDAQGSPVPGATVTITSAGVAKHLVTDSNGRFFAPFLAPGLYSVKVELSGFSPIEQKGIQVRLGARLELKDLTLKIGDVTEVIEVVGSAPVVDTSSTTIGGTLDSETISKLPVGRAFTDSLYLLPGVSDSSYAGKANPSIGGASGLENNFVIDGVNASNTGFGAIGSYSRNYGSLGTGVTSDFIKETQVKTGGFEAEYGQASGGVVNVVTRSGSNEFHGAVFGYIQPPSLEASYKQLDTTNGTVNTSGLKNADVGLSLGGPIMKDKLFFFGTFNPTWETLTRTAPTGFPLASLGEVDRVRKTYSYAGKLSWQANSNHRFDASFFGDPAKADNAPQRAVSLAANAATRFSSLEYGGHSQSLRYDGIITPNWLVEASASHITNKFKESPEIDEWSISDRRVVPNIVSGGIGSYEADEGRNNQFSIKSTNLFNAAGSHQVRYGFGYEDISYLQGLARTGPSFTLSDGRQSSSGASIQIRPDPQFGSIWRVTRAQLGPGRETTQKYWSAFLQDTWRIGERLTLRPGVRIENQKLQGSQEFPVCLSNQEFVGDTGGGGTPVACEYTFGPLWSPRLGATYDLTGNGKAKVFASYGKFYVKIPNDMAARALSADAALTVADYFDAGLTQPVPNGVTALGTTNHLTIAGLHPATIANGVASTYSSEFVGGFEFEAAPRLNVGVRYVNRKIPVVMEDFAPAQVILYTYGIPPSIEYIIDNINSQTPTTNPADFGLPFQQAHFEDPVHKYQSIEVTANKSFSDNWSMIASYRWSQLKGNYEGFFRSDNGQSDPGITSLFDFPTNDPSYTADGAALGFLGDIRYQGTTLGQGKLPNDRPHQFKLYTNRTFGSLNVGVAANVGSGRSLTALASNPGYQNSGEIPLTLRGGGFQTADGFKRKTDTEVYLDGHLDYTMKFGNQRVVLLADAFNLLNTQKPLAYDNIVETTFGVANPDFGTPRPSGGATDLRVPSYHVPFQLRIGARVEW